MGSTSPWLVDDLDLISDAVLADGVIPDMHRRADFFRSDHAPFFWPTQKTVLSVTLYLMSAVPQ